MSRYHDPHLLQVTKNIWIYQYLDLSVTTYNLGNTIHFSMFREVLHVIKTQKDYYSRHRCSKG